MSSIFTATDQGISKDPDLSLVLPDCRETVETPWRRTLAYSGILGYLNVKSITPDSWIDLQLQFREHVENAPLNIIWANSEQITEPLRFFLLLHAGADNMDVNEDVLNSSRAKIISQPLPQVVRWQVNVGGENPDPVISFVLTSQLFT